jgi:hypothetical protein
VAMPRGVGLLEGRGSHQAQARSLSVARYPSRQTQSCAISSSCSRAHSTRTRSPGGAARHRLTLSAPKVPLAVNTREMRMRTLRADAVRPPTAQRQLLALAKALVAVTVPARSDAVGVSPPGS